MVGEMPRAVRRRKWQRLDLDTNNLATAVECVATPYTWTKSMHLNICAMLEDQVGVELLDVF